MSMFLPVAATSGQIFIVNFFVVCCRFFFYHEALSTVASHHIKVFGLCPPEDWFSYLQPYPAVLNQLLEWISS